MNNAGLIAKITGIRPHSNADTLSVGLVNYNEVIIKNGTYKEGDLVLYIPVDCQIGEKFAIANKLVKSEGGYLDNNKRNITALRLRGEKSNGLVLSLSSLEGLVNDVNSLKDGDDISELKGEVIVQKYIPLERKKQNEPRQQQSKKLKPEEKTLYPFFKEHLSTSHLTRNLHKFKIGDKINVTLKLHGTSQRVSNTLTLRRKKENWIQKLISKLMKKKPQYDKAYELTTGTRRVILKDFSQKQFYENNNFRKKWHDFFIGKLDEGITVYFEVVGYTEKGNPIMGRHSAEKFQDKEIRKKYGKNIVYSYGCKDGESDIYVYRITKISEDGFIKEFSDLEISEKCKEWGCKQVPLLDSFVYSGEDDIKRIIDLGDAECILFPEHPKEGVVARIDSSENQFDVYKYKSFVFCELEGIAKNSGVIDMEEAESLEAQEV